MDLVEVHADDIELNLKKKSQQYSDQLSAPRIMTILTYFWPLFASTTMFFVAIIAFGGVSKFSAEDRDEKAGQGLLDYVAGMPEYT
uniref:Uncharacterized protein LOC113787556 n=1 Tax=Cicer arietinum TaxID=3827 RepID=A0A3Q7XF69_CICAR|nr:uncharacterized protein LOC113787556 [Cicer arietinum]